MTLLSIYRLFEVLDFKIHVLRHVAVTIAVIITTITALSLMMAIAPLMSTYKDLFVNGMTYNPNVTMFLPFVNRETHSHMWG